VEGEYTDTRKIKVVAHRCKQNCDTPVEPDAPCPENIMKWSDPKTWDPEPEEDKRVDKPLPSEGESFVIP
jgi:hypothetical protein